MKIELYLDVPGTEFGIRPGDEVKLYRFSTDVWKVNYGWFEFDGNRPMCGWYLTNIKTLEVKPLLKPDLDDIYVITK